MGDVKVIEIPAVEVASRIGDPMVSGTVLIGAYAEATKTNPADFIEKELEVRFGIAETRVRASEKEILLSHNMEALKQGMALLCEVACN